MRKKIRLEMEELAVDSFTTVGDDATKRGTVEAHSYTDREISYCCEPSASGTWPCLCNTGSTCDTTCNQAQCDCASAPCATFVCG